ncbi:MAG: hypothetical protein WDN29_08650 [Methylovirgula sp.]
MLKLDVISRSSSLLFRHKDARDFRVPPIERCRNINDGSMAGGLPAIFILDFEDDASRKRDLVSRVPAGPDYTDAALALAHRGSLSDIRHDFRRCIVVASGRLVRLEGRPARCQAFDHLLGSFADASPRRNGCFAVITPPRRHDMPPHD